MARAVTVMEKAAKSGDEALCGIEALRLATLRAGAARPTGCRLYRSSSRRRKHALRPYRRRSRAPSEHEARNVRAGWAEDMDGMFTRTYNV